MKRSSSAVASLQPALGAYPVVGARPRVAPQASSRHSLVFLILPLTIVCSMLFWRVLAQWHVAGFGATQTAAGAFDLMVPREGSRRGTIGGQTALHIVGGCRPNRLTYGVVTAEGQRISCTSDEYNALVHGGTVVARVIYFPPTSPRSTSVLTTRLWD